MKRLTIHILASVVLFTMSTYAVFSQTLAEALQGQESLEEIMRGVDAYYQDLERKGLERRSGEPKYKHWKRYEWYMSNRLGAKGEFVSISDSILAAKRKLQQYEQTNDMRGTLSVWTFVGPTVSAYAGNGGNWEIGNGIGRVDRIAFHPTDSNTIYVGTPSGGIWKTSNGGTSWTPLDDYLPSLGVAGIVVSHNNPNIVYALTGDGDSNIAGGLIANMGYMRTSVGVLKSFDAGATWRRTGVLATGNYVSYKLVQSPTNANVLLRRLSRSLLERKMAVRIGLRNSQEDIMILSLRPGSGTDVYVVGTSEARFSDDSGETWTLSTFSHTICCNERLALAVSPDEPNSVYVLGGPSPTAGQFDGIFKSTNSGQTYTRVSNVPNLLDGATDGSGNGGFNTYIHNLAADPSNADILVSGCILGFKSTNGGANWNNITTYWEPSDPDQYVHPDIHDVQFHPITGALYIASDGGLYRSYDLGVTWDNIGAGIHTTQFYGLTGHSNVNYLAAGTQDNGLKFRQNATGNFDHFDCCDAFDFSFSDEAGKYYSSINQGINRYENYGADKTGISAGPAIFFRPVVAHPTLDDLVFIGNTDVYRSFDSGDNCTNIGAAGSWAIEICLGNTNRLYAAGRPVGGAGTSADGELWKSEFLGATWTRLDGNPGFPGTFSKITDIATNPSNSLEVIVTMAGFADGQKVYRSVDTGATWTNITGSLPNVPVNTVAVTSSGHLYVGTDIGVFFKTPSMSDWIPYSNLLPRIPITKLVIHEGNSLIRAASFGRGIWQASLSNGICETNLAWNLNVTIKGVKYYQADNSLTNNANMNIIGSASTDVAFKAGNFIDLKPGFRARNDGLRFQAYIGPCTTGGVPFD